MPARPAWVQAPSPSSLSAATQAGAVTHVRGVRARLAGRQVGRGAGYCRTASSVQSYEAIGERRSGLT